MPCKSVMFHLKAHQILKPLPFIVSLLLLFSRLHAQTSLDTAVGFTVKDVNGITHYLDEYLEQDKIVVIDFFTITCGPCVTYAPLISESYSHFGCNTSNVVFLGINWGADNAGVADFGISNGVHYPEISGTEGNGNHVVADYGILSYPTVILVLPDSYIAEKQIWPPSTQNLDSIIAMYGGIAMECTTPVPHYNEAVSLNRIVSVYPVSADSDVTLTTTISNPGSAEVCSLEGLTCTARIPVWPDQDTHIATGSLSQGFYLIILRNADGFVIDRKPFVIAKQ